MYANRPFDQTRDTKKEVSRQGDKSGASRHFVLYSSGKIREELEHENPQEYQLDFEEYRAHPRSLSPEESKKFNSVMYHLMNEAYDLMKDAYDMSEKIIRPYSDSERASLKTNVQTGTPPLTTTPTGIESIKGPSKELFDAIWNSCESFITEFRKCHDPQGKDWYHTEYDVERITGTFGEFQQNLLELEEKIPGKHEQIIQFVNGVRQAKDKWKDAKIAGCILHLQDYGQQLQECEQDCARLRENRPDGDGEDIGKAIPPLAKKVSKIRKLLINEDSSLRKGDIRPDSEQASNLCKTIKKHSEEYEKAVRTFNSLQEKNKHLERKAQISEALKELLNIITSAKVLHKDYSKLAELALSEGLAKKLIDDSNKESLEKLRKLQGLEKEVEENSQRFGKLWSSIQAEDVNIINHLTLVDIQQTLDAATNGFKERRKKYGSKIDAKEAQKTIVRITSLSMDDVLKDFAHFREVLEKQTSIKNEHYDIRTEIYEEYSRVQTAQISRLETIRSRFSPRPEAGLENIGTGYYSDDEPLFEDPGQSGFGDDDMMDITHGSRQGSPDTSMFGVPRDAQQENLERNKWAEGAEYPYFFNK